MMTSNHLIATACLAAASVMAPEALAQRTLTPRARTVAVHGTGSSFLGVGVADIDAERARALKLKEEYGVEVKSVEADSPASKGGIQVGDVVLEYNGQRVEGLEQFIRLVRETPPGRQSKLLISRLGATQTLTATLGSREASMFRAMDGFEIAFPQIPEIRFPDTPRAFTMWRNPTLGIESESLGSQLAEYFGVKDGVLVRSVAKDSAGGKAGLKAGDVIVKIDDKKVASPREAASALRSPQSKKNIPISIVRDRKEMTLHVTLDDEGSMRDKGRTVVRMERLAL